MAAPEVLDGPVPAIPARIRSVAELFERFRFSKRNYWVAFIEHNLLVKEHERDARFEASNSPHVETMAFFNAEMKDLERQLAERGQPVPSRSSTISSLFLDDSEPDDAAVAQPSHPDGEHEESPSNAEEGELAFVPLRASLEAAWNRVDCAYDLAWVQQHLFLLRFPDATDEDIANSPFATQMMIRGRALDHIEHRLLRMGWVRPPPRLASEVFPQVFPVDL